MGGSYFFVGKKEWGGKVTRFIDDLPMTINI